MANQKKINTRQQQKYDTAERWEQAGQKGFVPLAGEMIVYVEADGARRIKVGDSNTNVNDLPFVSTLVQINRWEADD